MKKIMLSILAVMVYTVSLAGCSGREIPAPAESPVNIETAEPSAAETGEEETYSEAEEPAEGGQGAEAEEPVKEEQSAEAEEPAKEEQSPEETGGDAVMTKETGELRKAVNSFNRSLYTAYGEEGNIFYSPFSLFSALALTKLSAKGETAEEIEKALSIDDDRELLEEMKAYNGRKQQKNAYFNSANALFIDGSLKLSPGYTEDFKKPAEEYFRGEFKTLDFRGDLEGAKKEISGFVKDKTEGMISDYDPAVSIQTVADILNAVYFYGEWQDKFSSQDTFTDTFHGREGDTDAEMMHKDRESFRYVSDVKGIKAVALPYGNGDYEMDILIRKEDDKKDYSGLFDGSEEEVLKALDNAPETELRSLMIPKFNMDTELDELKERLKSLGIRRAFKDEADFSLLAENLKITDVSHRAKVEVDEEGSRAAAVTEIVMELTSMAPDDGPEEEFIADRPFVFFIRDRESGIILFTGRVNDINNITVRP